jgi:basic membrane protein A
MIANPPNICPVLPKEYEASFLAGLIAGYTTKTGKIGIAGGFPNKLMIRLLNTYEYGARIGSPRVEVIRAYANSWSDVTLGKQMAGSMIDKGADVLFFYANQVGLGAIQSCKKWIATKYMAGELEPIVNELGMSEGVISMSFTDEVSPEVREIVEQAADLIAEGKLLKFVSQFPEALE